MPDIAFVGLGRMGTPMCAALVQAGYKVTATDKRAEREPAAIACGASWQDTAARAASAASVLITMLPGPREVRAALLGQDGALTSLAAGAAWIDMTSNSPAAARPVQDQAIKQGVEVLEAPAGGGIAAAREGTLQLFVGGEASVVERHRAVLEVLGDPGRITHVGGHGTGYTVKLLVNLLWFGQAVATAEALLLGQRAGIHPAVLRQVLAGSAAASTLIRDDIGLVFRGDYLDSFGLDRICEELDAVTALAGEYQVPWELSDVVRRTYRRALDRFGPADGELLAVSLLEDEAGDKLRTAGVSRSHQNFADAMFDRAAMGKRDADRRPVKAGTYVASSEQVRELLERGFDYEAAARQLGIPPGQAYLIATGRAADGSDAPADHPGGVLAASQHLANPPHGNPASSESVLDWIAARVAADRPMREAAARRSAQPEPPKAEDPEDPDADEYSRDVTVVLTRQHNQVRALLEQLQALPSHKTGGSADDLSARKSIVDMITIRLSQHETTEEKYLWPAVRKGLGDGDALADEALSQEQEGTRTLAELGSLDAGTDRFDECVEQLVAQCRKHVAFEEKVFARLRDELPDDERERLGRKIETATAKAPTRPHKRAPNMPGVAVRAAAAGGAAADKVRDAAGHRPAEREGNPA